MTLRKNGERILAAHARAEAFAPKTIAMLDKLGYRIISADLLECDDADGSDSKNDVRPDLRIVDERRFGEVPDELSEQDVQMIVLTGRHGVTGADGRIVGAVKRPAGLHDMYRLLQQVFEEHPRATPRVPVHLRAHCLRDGREWGGAVLSLSENGCLLRSAEPLPLGTQFNLRFELPRLGPVDLWAETAYQLVPDLGLVFNALAPADRDAIASYVGEALIGA